jgi:dTDP-4-dehydrorhamnose 3,5-epimerase
VSEAQRLEIPGLMLILLDVFKDDRGFFRETYKRSGFALHGIDAEFVQDNHSRSVRNVLRGLHYQIPPRAQGKLVFAMIGRIWDVAVDIRPGSPTFGKWAGVELSEDRASALWVPPGFAHGFVVLSEVADVVYKCTAEYDLASERGIRWDDPDLDIRWPIEEAVVSEKDRRLPAFKDAASFHAPGEG